MDQGWQHAFVLGVTAVAAAWLIHRAVRRRGARPCGAGRHGCGAGHGGAGHGGAGHGGAGHGGADGFVAVERL